MVNNEFQTIKHWNEKNDNSPLTHLVASIWMSTDMKASHLTAGFQLYSSGELNYICKPILKCIKDVL